MEVLKKFAFILMIGLLCTACGNSGGGKTATTPSEVAKTVLDAHNYADFETVKKYMAKEFIPGIDEIIADLNTAGGKILKKTIQDSAKEIEYVVVSEKISTDGKTASVVVEKVLVNIGSMEETWPLIKEDGLWKFNQELDILF